MVKDFARKRTQENGSEHCIHSGDEIYHVHDTNDRYDNPTVHFNLKDDRQAFSDSLDNEPILKAYIIVSTAISNGSFPAYSLIALSQILIKN